MHNGIAIVLAWPETLCKKAGAWYDYPLKWASINKNNYYKHKCYDRDIFDSRII